MSDHLEVDRLVDGLSEAEANAVVTFVQFFQEGQPSAEAPQGRPAILEGAVAVPRSEWRVTLDGFTHVFFDVPCRLWGLTDQGDAYTLAQDVPLGQVYFDEKGSESDSVQVAINRSGSVYGDFRFMHRVDAPTAIYLKRPQTGEFADLIIESAGAITVLEMGRPERPAPGKRSRGFMFPELIKRRQAD